MVPKQCLICLWFAAAYIFVVYWPVLNVLSTLKCDLTNYLKLYCVIKELFEDLKQIHIHFYAYLLYAASLSFFGCQCNADLSLSCKAWHSYSEWPLTPVVRQIKPEDWLKHLHPGKTCKRCKTSKTNQTCKPVKWVKSVNRKKKKKK